MDIDDNGSPNDHETLPAPLRGEYNNLVEHPIDHGMYRPVLFPTDDVVMEPVPGNIRRMKHFIGCMKKIIEHFKVRLRWASESTKQQQRGSEGASKSKKKGTTGTTSPLAFLHQMMNATALDAKTLRFVHARVESMLRTLGVAKDTATELLNVAYLTSLLGFTNTLESSEFAIVLEPTSVVIGHHARQSGLEGGRGRTESAMMLQVACLNPSLAMKPIFERFGTVLLTSSTLSPISYYPKLLRFEPVVAESIPMSTIRPCVNPLMISRGSDQLVMSTGYKERFTMGCIRNYGKMLVDLVSSIPDGVVVYFPSYSYMEMLICEWDATGIMREMTEWKLVFVETKDNLELNTIALDNYRASCDTGRGGVFFSVARGYISEAIPFDLHYGRAVVMIGIPYDYTLSRVVRARLEYIQTHFDIREQDYLTFDAVRQVAKCFGRAIRSKTDCSVLVFADSRFHKNDKRTKLPGWVGQFLTEGQQDLTTDMAVARIKNFLRQTGQPVDQKLLQSLLLG